jgi:DNA-binding LytR/AlgR family response regulator
MPPIIHYSYIVIDDEKNYREQVIELVNAFNESEQTHFVETHDVKIHLQLLREHDGLNNHTLQDMQGADLVFLDLRFGETEMGIHLLNMANNANRKNIVVLTNYKADYEKKAAEFPQVLSWLHKPLNIKNLEISIDKFYIRKEGILAVFKQHQVEITAKNTEPILYDNIVCIKSGGQEVNVFLKNGDERTFAANVFSVTRFDGKGYLKRISPSCAINIALDWKIENDENVGLFVQLDGFKKLPENELKITNIFRSIVPVLSKPMAERV